MNRLIFQIKATRKEPTGLPKLVAGLIIWDMEKLVTAVTQAEPWMWLLHAPDKSSSQEGGTSILLLSLSPHTQLAHRSKQGFGFFFSYCLKNQNQTKV